MPVYNIYIVLTRIHTTQYSIILIYIYIIATLYTRLLGEHFCKKQKATLYKQKSINYL